MPRKLRPGQHPVWAPIEVGVHLDRVDPAPGWVILKEQFLDETTDSGIVVVKPYVANTVFGKVIAMNVEDQFKSEFFPGDNVVFREYSGGRWAFQGETVLITPLEAVLATYEA